jgi:hypothetical protein
MLNILDGHVNDLYDRVEFNVNICHIRSRQYRIDERLRLMQLLQDNIEQTRLQRTTSTDGSLLVCKSLI